MSEVKDTIVAKVDAEDKKDELEELREAEVKAAFEEELGQDWLAEKPFLTRVMVQFCRFYSVMIALYFFLVSLSLMGSGFTALTGKSAGDLFTGVNNPIVGLMVGIMATVLVQSSSTTTSIIVVLVGNGIIEVPDAIPMIMGANIGTSVTNTIVSIGFMDDPEAYERGFAGATVHDMFNYLNVALLLPIELIVNAINNDNGGPLQLISEAITKKRKEGELEGGDDFKDANPIKKITAPILDKMIKIDKKVVTDTAQGFPAPLIDGEVCTTDVIFNFESSQSEDLLDTLDSCDGKKCNFCPNGQFNLEEYNIALNAFNENNLITDGRFADFGDNGGGIAALIIALLMLIVSLAVIVKVLTKIAQGAAQRVLVKSLNHNYPGGLYVSILVGVAITFVVQSSSITTSILTPLVAIDALSLESMFPYTLGANIGTTGTGLIAAAADGDPDGYTIALVHLFFNIFGTLIWFPVPFIRAIPLNAARFLGSLAAIWKMVPIVYIVMAFLLYPLVIFGLSEGFSSNTGGIVVSTIFLLALVAGHGYLFYFYKYRDGKAKFISYIEKKREKLESRKKDKEQSAKVDIMEEA